MIHFVCVCGNIQGLYTLNINRHLESYFHCIYYIYFVSVATAQYDHVICILCVA